MQPDVIRGNYNQMDVVRHEAVGNDFHAELPGLLSKQFEICDFVATTKKYPFTMIPPLCHMMGNPRKDNARVSRHLPTLTSNQER